MMRRLFISILVSLLIPVGIALFSASSDHHTPRDALTKAYDALLAGDAEQYSQYVDDKRFDTKKEAISLYETLIKEDPLVRYKILNRQEIDPNTHIFVVREENGATGTIIDVPVTVKKTNSSWQMQVPDIPFEDYEINIVNDGFYYTNDDFGLN